MTTRQRGIYVTPLDLSDLVAQTLAEAQKAKPERNWNHAHLTAHYALGVGPDGSQYVVDDDGVGCAAADFQANVYLTENENEIALLPAYGLTLDADELAAHATGDPVDLADHIRTFGARLERNFDLWAGILTGKVSA